MGLAIGPDGLNLDALMRLNLVMRSAQNSFIGPVLIFAKWHMQIFNPDGLNLDARMRLNLARWSCGVHKIIPWDLC